MSHTHADEKPAGPGVAVCGEQSIRRHSCGRPDGHDGAHVHFHADGGMTGWGYTLARVARASSRGASGD